MSGHSVLLVDRDCSLKKITARIARLCGYEFTQVEGELQECGVAYRCHVNRSRVLLRLQPCYDPNSSSPYDHYRFALDIYGSGETETDAGVAWDLFRQMAEDCKYRLMLTWDEQRCIAEHDSLSPNAQPFVYAEDSVDIYLMARESRAEFLLALERGAGVSLDDQGVYEDAELRLSAGLLSEETTALFGKHIAVFGLALDLLPSENVYWINIRGIGEEWTTRLPTREGVAEKILAEFLQAPGNRAVVNNEDGYAATDYFDRLDN